MLGTYLHTPYVTRGTYHILPTYIRSKVPYRFVSNRNPAMPLYLLFVESEIVPH